MSLNFNVMKHMLLILGTLLTLSTVAQIPSDPEISFEDKSHNFGQIAQNEPATHEFEFTNSGSAPLIISEAEGSCGCTVPEWPKEPIMPGKTGVIKVIYDAKKVGPFQKSVTITSNDPNSPSELRIKGEVNSSVEG